MKRVFLLIGFLLGLAAMGQQVHWQAGSLSVTVDRQGYFASMRVCGQEVLLSKQLYPVVSAFDHQVRTPQSVRFSHDTLFCLMNDDREVLLRVRQLPECLTMEVIACPEEYNSLTFGPVAVNVDAVVGEVVGVVQADTLALGMQALNAKTFGGIPPEAAKKYSEKFFYHGHQVDGRPGYALAATRIEGGTVLQLSGRQRGRRYGHQEVRETGGCHAALADPVADLDAPIVGTKVALFGCRRANVLEHIGAMETLLGLPHPMAPDGSWVKLPPKKVEDPAPGHDLKCAEVYRVMTVRPCVPWDDPMVRSELSAHFQPQLMFQLEEELDAADTTLSVLTGAFSCFPNPMAGQQVVRIADELIRYRTAEDAEGHVTLRGCRRGAFGTVAQPHAKHTTGCRLWTVAEGFVPDLALLDTLADRAVRELNGDTALAVPTLVYFEHLEGCAYTGQDAYAVARFVSRCCEGWRRPVVAQADYLANYTWHYLSGITGRRSMAYPDMLDTTWRFIREVPVHDHSHDHKHSHAHEHAHEEEHSHEAHAEAPAQPQLPPLVVEESILADFLKRNLLR